MLAPREQSSPPLPQPQIGGALPSAARLVPVARPAGGRELFGLRQLEVSFEESTGTLWSFMRPEGRPSYNPALLRDFDAWQDGIEARFADRPTELRYLVLG